MRKIIFALALGAILVPDYGFTLGLGEIEVTTALNQELNAEIELLSAAPEDVETLIVKLASREEFSRAGIDRPYMLNSLRFSAEIRDGVPFIKVTSDKPVREPYLNFLIEIDWPKGHMMREYTILLDPPIFMEQVPVQQEQMRPAAMESSRSPVSGAMPEPQSSSGFRPTAMAVTASTTSAVPVPVPSVQADQDQAVAYQATTAYSQTYSQPPGEYRIQKGDTLWSLADSMRPDRSVTIEQMMLAMLRSNPEAFINDNVNGLKRGYILRIPDRDDIVVMSQAEAVALVQEQNALWREYQQAVTGGEPASAMDIAAQGDAGADLDASVDSRLEIVAAGSGTTATGSKDPTQMSSSELRAELALARESLETERVEKEELQQRVQSLEGQVDRMKSLLTLEDADMAEMQQAATPVASETMPEVAEEVVVETPEDVAVEQLLMDDGAALEDIGVTEEVALDEVSVEEDAEQQLFIDEEPLEVVEELVEQPAATTEDFSVAPNTEPAFMQPQKQGPIAALLNNPVLLAAAGGGLLLVLLLVALIMKRRKSGDEEQVVTSNLEDIAEQIEDRDVIREVDDTQVEQELAAEQAEAETVKEKIDTESAAVSPSAEDTVVTPSDDAAEEPRDDIIAEADVYLAYGIYQQAEELLQNAIKNNPDKDSYRVKLAETYSAGKNADAFIELATEMNQRRDGEDTPAWQKIVAIGNQLVPNHALFTGATVGDLSMDDLSSQAPETMDIDLDSDAEQEALAPDLDLSFDEPEAEDTVETKSQPTELVDSVEFDLAETGAETKADIEEEDEGVAFDLTETQAFEAGTETGEFSLDIEASELGVEEAEAEESSADEFDLDLSAEAEAALAADDEDVGGEISLDDIDDASLDLDIGSDETGVITEPAEEESQPEKPKAVEPQEEAADIIDFAERAMEEHAVEAQAESASFADSMDDDLDLSDLDDIDEVSTKLDLAKAYLDMGDADGTRSILDEVMSEGNDDQKREADDLLRQLG